MAMGFGPASAAIPDVVHPAYELKTIPMPALYRTMGLDFLSDGRMVLATTQLVPPYGDVPAASADAKLYVVSGMAGAMDKIQVKEIANTWMQMTGITVVNDTIYVADRDAQYRILDKDNPVDLKANRSKVVDWPDEGKWNRGRFWHQYLFTPLFHKGYFHAPYSGSIGEGGMSNVPPTSAMSGAFLKWKPGGALEIVAGGLRSPNGLNISPAGDMMVTDNQGGWFPASTFSLIKPGRFYGCRNTTPNFAESWPYQPPVAWLPHGDIRRSPTQAIHVPKGPHQGDWLMGDIFHTGLVRVNVDTIKGEYQGGVFWFSRGTGNSAINRLAWGPDGALYLGTVERIGSLPMGGPSPMYRMSLKSGAAVFEMKSINLLADGFQIEFTAPVDKATAAVSAFTLSQWKYVRTLAYGEGRVNDPAGTIFVTGTGVSADGRRVHVKVNKLTTDRVVHFKLAGIRSAVGQAPFDDESWYTLNNLSAAAWNPAAAIRKGGDAARRNGLDGILEHRALPGGILEVTVDSRGRHSLFLAALDGTVVRRAEGSGPALHRMDAGRLRSGIYLLGLKRGPEIRVEKVHL